MALDPNPDSLPEYLAAEGSSSAAGDGPNFYLNADERASTASNGKPSFTIPQAASQLIQNGPGWSAAIGQAFTVTYAFRSSAPNAMPSDTAGFSRFNEAQIVQAELALKAWADVANITFVRVGAGTAGDVAYSNNAAILLANYSSGQDGASAFANFPGLTAANNAAGDVWVNSTLSYNQAPSVGNYGGMVLVHELGHAIGLAHPSDYDATSKSQTTLTYAKNADYYEDSRQYTVMSYFSESNTGASFGGRYSAAPLLDDIAAAQLEYGANMNTRTGDTVYGFNSSITDRPWYVATSNATKVVFAVWDAGGVDTFDFSGYSSNQLIDLRQGNFSNVGGLIGNVAVALGAEIENAIGGSGADALYGNALANVLTGGGGNDTLDGGDGFDTASFAGPSTAYKLIGTAAGWMVQDLRADSPDGADTLVNIESLQFSDGNLSLVISLPADVETAFNNLTRATPLDALNKVLALSLTSALASGAMTDAQAFAAVTQAAITTTAVATLSYQFFTGKIPSAAGVDYLVSPTGPNGANLNSAYYQSFNLENRYINFAVNLGKNGEGKDTFAAQYGGLSLAESTKLAYQTIFGSAPSDDKVHALIDSRVDYFAYYGQDGSAGIGTKAAMVGWLLAEAAKADVGVYAKVNDAFMADLVDGADFAVNIVGVYYKAEYVYTPA